MEKIYFFFPIENTNIGSEYKFSIPQQNQRCWDEKIGDEIKCSVGSVVAAFSFLYKKKYAAGYNRKHTDNNDE